MNPNNPKLSEISPRRMSSVEIEKWLRSVQSDLEEPGMFVPEMNSIRWDWEAPENVDKPKYAFLLPVSYRGMIANLGVNILHEEMNRYRNQICERIYFPYPKLFKRLIVNHIPLFSNESFHQALDFEVLGISSYYPLQFLAFPRLIKMSGMEPYSKDRREEDPIIMFGGVAAFNPAPVADFVDIVNLGDGEKVLADAVQLIHDLRKLGVSKHDILVEIQKTIPGSYVPCLYKEEYYPADDAEKPNQFKAHVPLIEGVPERVKKYTCEIKDVRPVSKIIQPNSLGDDLSSGAIEITRGCGHACAFCFIQGTLIETSSGAKDISLISSNDLVFSIDSSGNKCLSRTQGSVLVGVKKTYTFSTGKYSVTCTPDHKFLSSDGSYISAMDAFRAKTLLKSIDNSEHRIFSSVEYSGEQEVYDLTVFETHNYFANGFVVHNCEGSFRSKPYRERNLGDIYKAIDVALLDSGSASLTPYAFNLSDHHRIFDILNYAMTKWPTRIGMSSQHVNHFSEQMADMALMTGTRSITIAIESADPVMRRRIGKTLTDERIEEVIRLIVRKGFTSIKIYMISNLPYEDDVSLHEIENLSRKMIRWQIEEQSPLFPSKEAAHEYVSRPEFDAEIDKFAASCKLAFHNKSKIIPEGEEYWNLHLKYKLITRIKFSYTSFNGKAHTPMQWARVLKLNEEGFPDIRRDMHTIFDVIQACGHSFRMSGDLEISTLNQVLSYADRRFSSVLVDLCNDEHFNYRGTLVAGSNSTMKDFANLMAKHGFDYEFFYREKGLDEAFPWDFIDMGVTKKYLKKRWQMYQNAKDDIRCQEKCTGCGGCTPVSKQLFKRYWNEGLEEKKYKYVVNPIIKRENVCKIRFRFHLNPKYRWLYGFNKKSWLRRAFYRAGFPIRTGIQLASDIIEFNNFTYSTDYGEVWLYSKNFSKANIAAALNATFDEQELPLVFDDAVVGESSNTFRMDISEVAYAVQIPAKFYTKAVLDSRVYTILNSDEVIIRQKVASTVKRDSTEVLSIDVKQKLHQLFVVGNDGFSTIYFKLDFGLNPYSFLVTLLNTSISRCKKFPIEVRDYLAEDSDASFDMFTELCEDCGESIERNIFDEAVHEKYCLKCSTLHEKQALVVNLDSSDDDEDIDLDNFDMSFMEEEELQETHDEPNRED